MRIRKITKIQNIGKFHKGGISGGEFGKFTLFYAGNGRGKTTLCAALRSLTSNDASLIQERRTLGATGDPEIHVLCDAGLSIFTAGAWNNPREAIHVFDNSFVIENVHAGELVSTDNRRNMYRIIVGTKGVQLAEELDSLDAEITALTSSISAGRLALQQHAPKGMEVEAFIALAEDSGVDAKISAQKAKIAAASKAAEIAAKPFLKQQLVPCLPAEFLPTLQKSVTEVSATVVQSVETHLAKHKFGKDGQTWVSTGLKHIVDGSCPFCANNLEGNDLVGLYGQFFDEAYKSFRADLVALQAGLASLSEAAGLRLKAGFEELAREVEYWAAFGNVDFVSASALDQLLGSLAALHSAASAAIEAKIAAPLEVPPLVALQEAMQEWEVIGAALKASNDSLLQANAGIQSIKASTDSGDKPALNRGLVELEAIKRRHTPEVKTLVETYTSLLANKAARVSDKEKKKEDLDAYDAEVLARYHEAINRYLVQFGAGFGLMKSEKNYVGKAPQWVYVIEINSHAVDVTKKAGSGEPCFQTVMSAGDRSTLALAFFLAQLELETSLKDAVVVFDDPFTSLDEFRRAMTARTMWRVGEAASQVIVFSHSKYFLLEVKDAVVGSKCETFQISTTKTNSSIEPWDLEREVKDGYLRAHMEMLEFHEGKTGKASEMRLKMRPLLESYIRYRFPNKIPDGKWLGEMLGIIRDDPAHPLYPLYQEIDDINAFTAPHHHSASTPFNDDEVRTYVGRTLAIVGGC